jgi:hypothetical protein
MNKFFYRIILLSFLIACSGQLIAQKTEIQYLSGTGSDNTVNWQFFCTAGKNSGKWTTIPVPSNWELLGFGKYNYGHDKDSVRGMEQGLYKYNFQVPSSWKGQQVNIVFEGSMTDTEVKINGKSAGAIHQGAFYRFKYDISKLLNYDRTNLLEVKVSKHSANNSVNNAERYCDFWIFGGIFRPVYLEAKPDQNIERVTIDAKADGTFVSDVFLNNSSTVDRVTAQVTDLKGNPVGAGFFSPVAKGQKEIRVSSVISGIKTWNPEDPNLYSVKFSLISKGKTIHETTERFGFRTVEVRERDGIYVNGVKIKFKGVNRHTFRPETGRASCKTFSMEDVKLMKEMNMNAVRMSHYPPDGHFLDVCDSLGLFVLDELAGWHGNYDTPTGTKLVEEMITHDVNHPSVVLWANGNEGGHNPALDPVFKQFDIQKRAVIYPWRIHDGFDTQHYINYDYGMGTYWHGHNIVLPTEFLHGLYDGGGGAGLYDYWELMWNTPRSAGGFLWVFADEGVVRSDKNGEIDTYGSAAPDGILGPHHEKEGSYFAIKEIWSPVKFEDRDITAEFDGKLDIENRYFYTNINTCSFTWKLAKMPLPGINARIQSISGTAKAPDILPGQKGQLSLSLPSNWYSYDVLYVKAFDKTGMELYTWSWPITLPKDMVARMMVHKGSKPVLVEEKDSMLIIKAHNLELTLGKKDGLLKKVVNDKGEIPFNNGPVLSGGKAVFGNMDIQHLDDTLNITCSYGKDSRMKEMVWTVYPSGWVKLDILYFPPEYDVHFDYMGVNFSYPEDQVKSVKWLGNGPYRVWKNRMQGVELDVHQKGYNRSMTGIPTFVYPEFKGYHSNLYWAEIFTKGQSFVVATASEDVFLRLFTPDQPKETFNTAPAFPTSDISFMQGIPPIGTKSQQAWRLGPSGQKNQFYDFGPFDNWRWRAKNMILYFDFTGNK